jgi:malate dehydrogenase (oxaloacetate-decarboxylating)
VNNSLVFPGIFRGALDVRARAITDGMAIAAARELAACGAEGGLSPSRLLPTMAEWRAQARLAAAVGMAAQAEGMAGLSRSRDELHAEAVARIEATRNATAVLMREGLIQPPP